MERRRSSGTIAKSMYYSQKRILAFLLTAAMVFTNLGTGLNVSYAGTADQVKIGRASCRERVSSPV